MLLGGPHLQEPHPTGSPSCHPVHQRIHIVQQEDVGKKLQSPEFMFFVFWQSIQMSWAKKQCFFFFFKMFDYRKHC